MQGYEIVFVTCRFESGPVDIKLIYDDERRIAGLWFVPTAESEGSAAAPAESELPEYADRAAFEETDLTVGSGEWELPGTLSIPHGEGPFPAVVLVHGSGPNDRDETIGPNKPFRDIAWGLASNGVAVLRYDKRTKVHAASVSAHGGRLTVKEEVVDDAVEAVRLLAGTERIDPKRIFVLGHSLGGMLAPRIGERERLIAGLVVIAGPTRPLENLMIEQYRYIFSLDGDMADQEQTMLDTLEAQAARLKDPALSVETPAELLPFGVGAAYWLDLRSYDPAETARTLEMPMLILQGERDYQVTMEDFAGWRSLLPSARIECKSYPALNHLFMEGEGKSVPAEYSSAGHVAGEVVDDIVGWIRRQ
jgi:dienelactone hydrolase